MKNFLWILFLMFPCLALSQNTYQTNLSGIISVSNGIPISYEISINTERGIVNGFSITDKGGKNETKSNIIGIYNQNTRTFKLRETKVLSTKSKSNIETFCYINMEVSVNRKHKLKSYEGTFFGLFSNGDTCAHGEIVLIEQEKLKKTKQKLIQKIRKPKIKNNKNSKTKLLKDGDHATINWKSELLVIYIWDKNSEDGDKINLSINNERILSDYLTKNKKKKLKYVLKKGINKIYIEAINNGNIPPNTASFELVDLKTKYPITTQLETGSSVIIKIIK